MDDDTKRVSEAVRDYLTDPPVVTMSSKRQVTLPAAMVRELGLKAGVKMAVYLDGEDIILRPQTRSWFEIVTGPPYGMYGRTKEEVDAYIREQREGWDRRARIAERDAYIPRDD